MATKSLDVAPTALNTSEEQKHFRLLDLPPELRLIIYNNLFKSLTQNDPPPTDQEISHITAILFTSHFIFHEARLTFLRYRYTLVQLPAVWLDTSYVNIRARHYRLTMEGIHQERKENAEVQGQFVIQRRRLNNAISAARKGKPV